MGNTVGAITGGIINDRAIGKGVAKAQEGYGSANRALREGKAAALGYLNPYIGLGEEAISPLSTLLLGRSFDPETGKFSDVAEEDRLNAFYESPDYQYRLQQGQKSLEASQAARGGLLSGRAVKELQTRGQNEASSEYGNFLARLVGLTGIGQNSATQAAGIETGIASQLANNYVGFGNVSAQGKIARGQNWADTAITVGSQFDVPRPSGGAAAAGGAGASAAGGAGAGGSAAGLAALFSDVRLKQNIKLVRPSKSGIPIYEFEYINKDLGKGRYEGVIAQDLLESHPEAVKEKDGFYSVDYSLIDVDFKEI